MKNAWMLDARCAPHEAWTEPEVDRQSLEWMRGICKTCPVARECASYALELNLEGGMFAGVMIPNRDGHRDRGSRDRAVSKARLQLRQVAV